MVKHIDNILDEARKKGFATPSAGMKVPDGYFDSFCDRMEAMLPERPEIEMPDVVAAARRPHTFWQKVRPYVYMAAMFAGVWCMLQIFTGLSNHGGLQPMQNNAVMAKALSSDEFMRDYIFDDINSWDLLDEMMEDGSLDSDSALDAFINEDFRLDEPAQAETVSAEYILPQ